jgi:hypothetical protein
MVTRSIWQFPFKTDDIVRIEMPEGTEVLSVQVQNSTPCMWALVNPESPFEMRTFVIYGTGEPIEDPGYLGNHLGSYQLSGVYHIFEPAA